MEEAVAADKARRLLGRACQTRSRQGQLRWRRAGAAGGEPFLSALEFQAVTALVFAGGGRWGRGGDGGAALEGEEDDALPWGGGEGGRASLLLAGLARGEYVFFCEGVAVPPPPRPASPPAPPPCPAP